VAPYTGKADYTSVTHRSEIPFVFGNTTSPTYFGGKPASYYDMATLMSRMWISSINDLTPNNHGTRNQPEWPQYGGKHGYGTNFFSMQI
jgi:carboxylesterase type B